MLYRFADYLFKSIPHIGLKGLECRCSNKKGFRKSAADKSKRWTKNSRFWKFCGKPIYMASSAFGNLCAIALTAFVKIGKLILIFIEAV
jgi:hypothetical protein